MSMLLSTTRVDWVTRHYRWLMLAGVGLLALGYRFDTFGFVTGAFLIPLGAGGGAFRAWRRERGLWMLACLFLVLFLPTYGIFEYQSLASGFRGSGISPWQVLDFTVATGVLFFQIRFFVTVARINWLFSQHMKESGYQSDAANAG